MAARVLILSAAEEARKRKHLQIERRRLRDGNDALDLPESIFTQYFRVNKDIFRQIIQELKPYLPQPLRNTGIKTEIKILATLSFLATGSYQKPVAQSFLLGMSQSSMCRVLQQVIDAFNTQAILEKFVKFPSTRPEREYLMRDFMTKFEFPGVIGCIDGTHVAIIRPQQYEESYLNRKHYHSLNVMIICDAQLNILHADASFGGASHDSHVWNQSPVKLAMERFTQNGEHCWLLGDSGYAQRPWLMTPVLGATPYTPEDAYNKLHCKVRNTVERCIGVLKGRWRCLLAHRTLHYTPIVAGKIVNACVVLHNITNMRGLPPADLVELDQDSARQVDSSEIVPLERDSSRDILIRRIWSARRN